MTVTIYDFTTKKTINSKLINGITIIKTTDETIHTCNTVWKREAISEKPSKEEE